MNITATAPGTSTSQVLDDDPASFKDRLSMASGLEPDFTCVRAASQAPAAAVVTRLRPDPVFMDVRVSEEDRVAAGQELSQVRRKLPVVAVTAHAGRTLEQHATDGIAW